MSPDPDFSEFRIEKKRSDATITLSSGDDVRGCFFVSSSSAHVVGPERVGELMNAEGGFFPFEVHDKGRRHIALFNRGQVVLVALSEHEARRDPGYDVATRRVVSMRLSNGRALTGSVRVHRPEGRNRLSDWARHTDQFRYVETDDVTFLVNVAHVIDVHEDTAT